MSKRSYIPWNVAGVVVAVVGFVVGSLPAPVGGGTHTTIADAAGLLGAAVAVGAFALETLRRRRTRRLVS